MAIKKFLPEESEYFTKKYGVPIEIRSRKPLEIKFELMYDRIIFYIPHNTNLLVESPRLITRENNKSMLKYIDRLVNKYSSKFDKKEKLVELNSTKDLKQRMDMWATRMGIRMPDKFGTYKSNKTWGLCQLYSDGSTKITLNVFLKFIPIELTDNTIVHELVHHKQFVELYHRYDSLDEAWRKWKERRDKHDKDFWREFDYYLPNNKQIKQQVQELSNRFWGITLSDH
jgi:predicted metal-dependent hydrolase